MRGLFQRRTPGRPGPGPVPEAVLRALDLTIRRRIAGLVPGAERAKGTGQGSELALIRPYVPGDDVRRIDWNVTARMAQPHVREDVAERALTSWLLLDVSPSMTFGTADRRKWDVAEGAALVLSHLATRHGGRIGVLAFGGGKTMWVPPRRGRAGLLGALHALREEPGPEGTGPTSVGDALRSISRVAHRGAFVAAVTDLRGPRDWERPLAEVTARHDVLAVEVRDPREQELPPMGVLWLVDPETDRQLAVDTSNAKLRDRFARAATAERDQVADALKSAGARHVVLSTSGDWLRTFATALRRERLAGRSA